MTKKIPLAISSSVGSYSFSCFFAGAGFAVSDAFFSAFGVSFFFVLLNTVNQRYDLNDVI